MQEAIQAGIYGALTGHAPLVAAAVAIYDRRPQPPAAGASSAYPYVTLGVITPQAWSADDFIGAEALAQIDVWSVQGGQREAAQLLDHVRAALDRAAVAVAGYTTIDAEITETRVELDPDGQTWHGIAALRLLICP